MLCFNSFHRIRLCVLSQRGRGRLADRQARCPSQATAERADRPARHNPNRHDKQRTSHVIEPRAIHRLGIGPLRIGDSPCRGLIVLPISAIGLVVSPNAARATEIPVNVCASSTPTAGPILPTGGSGGNVSYTPPNPTASLAKNNGEKAGDAYVDPSSGALIYNKTDLTVGVGKFPASLALNRTFNSRYVRDNGRPTYRAGGDKWYAFGFGGTHDLDIRFQLSDIYFGTVGYAILTIQSGFSSTTFQKCADGWVNMKRDGSRLYADSTFSNGFRYETRDGDKLYFQAMPQSQSNGTYYCNGSTRGAPVCGYIRRWVAPNGDRADFSYEEYYSNPTNATSPGGYQTYAMTGQGSGNECHINTKGAQDCRDTNQPWYVMRTGQTYATNSFAVNDFRLKEVSNSRGYKLAFSYVDNTVDVSRICQGLGDGYVCAVYNNEAMERNRVSAVSAWLWDGSQYQQLSSVQYSYADSSGANGNYLRSVTGTDGSVTRIEGIFDLYEPGQATASIKPTWSWSTFDSYYYLHSDEVHTSLDFSARTTTYPAVLSLKRGNDDSAQYSTTMAGRWLPDAYGRWLWQPFISRMQINDGVGTVIYDYLDDNLDDHYGQAKITDAVGGVEKYEYNQLGTLISKASPEGSKVSFGYDGRGNILWQRTDPKPGSSGQPITVNIGYVGAETLTPDQCVSQSTCNKMLWSADALNRRSDYEWDSNTGELRRVLGPTLGDGSRPETTIDYATFTGMSGEALSLPSDVGTRISVSQWKHEVLEYGGDMRHLLVGVVQSADGTSRRTCVRYDLVGNMVSETSPRAGLTACP